MDTTELDEFVLASLPTFIAINYQRLLQTQNPQEQITLILHIYNLGLRTLTINLVSQYLFRDRDRVSDPYLNTLLEQRFPHLTPDAWEEMLFSALRVYEGQRELFFMPELYDFYWDTSVYPHRRRDEVKPAFDRLTQATLDLQTERLVPQDEPGWQALADELQGHLQHILQSLSFIGTYDLIHVLTQDEHVYTFELHKGTHILSDQRPLPKGTSLTTGWFYLRAGTEEFLSLHPLLIFWEDTIEPVDTGVFDRLIYAHLRYLLATSRQFREGDKSIQEFVELIYDTIADVKRKRQEAERLSWVQLCDICEEITQQRMATVRGKYHRELYLQRDTARQHMETFLADPKKRGFVLVGKSGVGKSNFLLALAEELMSRSNVCVLMYDGANLPVASTALTEIISKDFSDRVFLSRQPVQHVWQEIAKIDGIDERLVILCVDAINENPEATELLRQLDELVQSPWSWLKVVLSSRPETWQSIKHGVKLAEALYYQDQGTEGLGVELEPFSYSEQMEPFSRQELPEAYSKYQRKFHLQTPYEALSYEVRETLCDPFNLLLLASTHRGQAIPANVKTAALIEQYVNTLLQREDRRFLEQQLLPLMVREGYYSNVITEVELDAAGGGLYELVYSDQVLSDGRRMNQAFLNLSDADILLLQKQGIEQQIVFKYERFYEYFAGKRIVSLSETHADRYAFFLALLEEATGKKKTTGRPFLWGAVRNVLVEEAKRPDSEIILKLCRTTEQRVKEMMVNVLITLGQDDPEQVARILRNLLPSEKKATEFQKIRQLVGKSAEVIGSKSRNARKIAIEVASNLGISWVLQTAALQADPTIRATAVRYSYHLWKRDWEKGFQILEHLAENATHGLIPNSTAFESAMGLSAVIFFEHYEDEIVLRRLQSIWREVIATILRIREESGRGEEAVRAFIRERFFSFVITVVFGLFSELPAYGGAANYSAIEAFFHLGVPAKLLYKRLIQYIDVEGSYFREQMENDFLRVMKETNNHLIVFVVQMGLIAHACHSSQAFLPFLQKFFEEAKKDRKTYPYMNDIVHVMDNVLHRGPMDDDLFDFFVSTVEVCQEYYTQYPEAVRNRYSSAPEALNLGPYIFYYYQKTGEVGTEWFKTRIQTALLRKDTRFFDFLITSELPLIGIERKSPKAALNALTLFFKSSLNASRERDEINILQFIITFLARLRVRYPDEVDDFLEEQHASEELQLQVRTNEPTETTGELIGQRSWYFLRDEIILKSPELRSQLMHVFTRAAGCKNMKVWLNYFLREVINLIYGGEALRQTTKQVD